MTGDYLVTFSPDHRGDPLSEALEKLWEEIQLSPFQSEINEIVDFLNRIHHSKGSNYMRLKAKFLDLFSSEVWVRTDSGELIEGIMLKCPLCSEIMPIIYLRVAEGSIPEYPYLFSELMVHLRKEHKFWSFFDKEFEGDRGMRTEYRCKICGEEVKGVIEAFCHLAAHAIEEEWEE